MQKFLMLVACAILSACANPYQQFYESSPGISDARTLPTYDASQTGVQIYTTNDFEKDLRALVQKSYAIVGRASFNASADQISQENIRSQAELVGAHVVLVSSQYSHTISGAIPLTVPQTQTSHTSGSATAYGTYGSATAYGHSTTTTYGSQTVMLPYSVARYDAAAYFLAKYRPRLGVVPLALTDDVRKARSSNQGIRADVVIDGSPAFVAGVLPDDIILSVNSRPLFSPDDLMSLVNNPDTRSVNLTIERGSKRVNLDVTLTPLPEKSKQNQPEKK